MNKFRTLLAIVSVGLLIGCSESVSPPPNQPNDSDPSDTTPSEIFLTDQTGKRWNITYAVRELGFDRSRFNFGLGPNAIVPIIDPDFWFPGDPGYPSATSSLQVLGISLGGEAKAYPIGILSRHEVANDELASTPIAASY